MVRSSAQYTLALPVARRRIVMTRIAAGYLLAAIGLAVSVAATAVTFEVFDRTAPVVPILLASGFASFVILFWMCVLTAMNVVAGIGWGSALTLLAMLVSSPLAMRGMSWSASRTLDWPVLLLLGTALAGAIWLVTEVAAGDEV
jgi:ABC-type transport system involved in multi-copper enzyme maturation permease subunit